MIENQLSTKFKGVFLGFSKKYTINDSGCLTACIARLVNEPLLTVHQKLKDGGCFFNECLLDLTKVPTVFNQLTYAGKFTYDNNKALEAIKRNGIVIAEVDYNPIMDGTQQHFVCMVGDGNIEDPLGGKIKPVTTYKTYLTLRIFEIKQITNSEPDMTNEEKLMLEFIKVNQITEGQLREGYGYVKDGTVAKQTKEIDGLKTSLKSLEERLTILESELTANNKLILDYQSTISTAKGSISNLQAQLKTMSDTSNTWKNRYESKLQETIDKYSTIKLLAEIKNRILKNMKKK